MSRARRAPEVCFVIDDRERLPYDLSPAITRRLATGDYSLVGCEHRIAIERKTHADAYGSLSGRARDRFQRELVRLGALEYGAIVIEASLHELLVPARFSRLHPRAAITSLLAWSVRYGVHVFFAGDREHAMATTRQLLEKFARYHCEPTTEAACLPRS